MKEKEKSESPVKIKEEPMDDDSKPVVNGTAEPKEVIDVSVAFVCTFMNHLDKFKLNFLKH